MRSCSGSCMRLRTGFAAGFRSLGSGMVCCWSFGGTANDAHAFPKCRGPSVRLVVAGQLLEKPDEGVEALRFVEQVGAMAGDHELFVFRQGAAGQDDRGDRLQLTGISDLLAPDGTFIHPRAAARTKFCSAYNRPAPEAVTSAHADVEPTGAAAFRAFLRHRSTRVPFLRQPSLHSAARQPAGTGSAQILRSISPKSRRFR